MTASGTSAESGHMTYNTIKAAFDEWRKTLTVADSPSNFDIFAQGHVSGWNAKEAAQSPAPMRAALETEGELVVTQYELAAARTALREIVSIGAKITDPENVYGVQMTNVATAALSHPEQPTALAQSSQGEMENYRLALAWIKGQATDPQAKEIAATALDSFTHTRPQRETP